MKLHVGCGQTILPGYINIDGYDNDERPDYWAVKPDLIAKADGLERYFAPGTIDEIRTHHMLEHIPIIEIPPVLICWNKILKIGGKLIVEVPDFDETVKKMLNAPSEEAKEVYYRCLFGSQVGPGEFHVNGISESRMRYYAKLFGFELISFQLRWVNISNNAIHFNYPVNAPLPYSTFLLKKVGPVSEEALNSSYTHLAYYKTYPRKEQYRPKTRSTIKVSGKREDLNHTEVSPKKKPLNKSFQYNDLLQIYQTRYCLWLTNTVDLLTELSLDTTSHGTLTMSNLHDQSNWYAHTIYYGRMWEYVKIMEGMRLEMGIKTLDCGGASSPLILAIAAYGYEIHSIDLSIPLVDNTIKVASKTRWPVRGYAGDMTDIHFPDDFFDNVVSCSVIEHLSDEDKIKAIQEMVRVVKPGGRISISMDWGGVAGSGDKSGRTYSPVQNYEDFRKYIIEPSGLELLGVCDFENYDIPVYPSPISVHMPDGWYLNETIRHQFRPLDHTLAACVIEK